MDELRRDIAKEMRTRVTLADIKGFVARGTLTVAEGANAEKAIRAMQAVAKEINRVKRLIRDTARHG
jgi:ribosomal protein S13